MNEDQTSPPVSDNQHDSAKASKSRKYAEGAFLAGVGGSAALFGFGMTIAMAKKRDPEMFTQGLISTKQIPESGTSLALRALGRGTLYSVAGFSLLCLVVWKAMGVKNLEEFRYKVGSALPRIPRNEPQGRTDFASLRDLLNYLIDEDNKKK